jgi:hypothetical protein
LSEQVSAVVAALPGDGFVVAWQSLDQDASETWGIYAQRYDGAGKRVGPELLVNRYTTGDQTNPSIASLPDGSFVIAWQSEDQGDDASLGIYAQRYDSSGHRASSEIHVNTNHTDDIQSGPSVAVLNDGGFVITWQSYGAEPAPGSSAGVYGQRYDNANHRVGANFLVNTETAGFQGLADVASLNNGGFVVVWTSADQDGDGHGVYGQRYAP